MVRWRYVISNCSETLPTYEPGLWEVKHLSNVNWQRLQMPLSHQLLTMQKNERERRLLCIRLEILTGVDSPADERALRMEYQVDMLQQGLMGTQSQRHDPRRFGGWRGFNLGRWRRAFMRRYGLVFSTVGRSYRRSVNEWSVSRARRLPLRPRHRA